MKRKADRNGLTCPEVCPIACSERELVVEGGINERQCLEPDTCKGEKIKLVFEGIMIICLGS